MMTHRLAASILGVMVFVVLLPAGSLFAQGCPPGTRKIGEQREKVGNKIIIHPVCEKVPQLPTVHPKRVATVEICKRNLVYRKTLADRLEKLEAITTQQHIRRGKIGSLYDDEEAIREAVIWDAVEDSIGALGPVFGRLKGAEKLSPQQYQSLMAARDTLAAALASGRPSRGQGQDTEKVIDAANSLKSTLMRSGLSQIIDEKAAEALIRMVDINVAVIKAAKHQTNDPKWQQEFRRQVEDGVALAAAAYSPVALGKGLVSVGTAGWYLLATRGNLDTLGAAFSKAQEAEMLLKRRVEALREKLKVYDKDIALCGNAR